MMKRLALIRPGELRLEHSPALPVAEDDELLLKVHYCAVCRTDAKMWEQGHRDLALPRVPGHELVAEDEKSGHLYALWPGKACGSCYYCRGGRENLCDSMKISGFHADGGFAEYVAVPRSGLVPLPAGADPMLYCFAEPVACVINAFEALSLAAGEKLVIYGGGVLGMLAAMVAGRLGAAPVVVEQSAEKIEKAAPLISQSNFEICKETDRSDFDCALHACDSAVAFSLCLTKLRKGGRFGYFSGVKKNEEVEFSLLNLIHYKELEVFGSYGPRKSHVEQAVSFCREHEQSLLHLVEEVVSPEKVPPLMSKVLAGTGYKYIIDFRAAGQTVQAPGYEGQEEGKGKKSGNSPRELESLVAAVRPVDQGISSAVEAKIDLKTKPLGALGRIEDLALQLGLIQQTLDPVVENRKMYVFAGDHGVVEEGVSAYPSKVTRQMVQNFLDGGAAINVFCRQWGIALSVVDMGVKGNFDPHPLLVGRKVAHGTANFAVEPAMSLEQAVRAVSFGAELVRDDFSDKGYQVIGLGEMGIGNTTAATAVISAVTGIAPAELAGRGTGVDNEGLGRKIEVLEKALAYHRPDPLDALDILGKVGGFELGGICGAILAAAANTTCIVLDGFISTAAGLLAYLLCPAVKDYLVAGHRSVEHGQQAALDYMGLTPIVDLDMRLGEGTGAAVTMNLIELAARVMREMASFDEAGVDRKL